jgi:hypothetical protein
MDVMLSDEAGRLPQQLFLKVGQWLKLAAYLYSPYCLEKLSEKSKLASNRGSASPKMGQMHYLLALVDPQIYR